MNTESSIYMYFIRAMKKKYKLWVQKDKKNNGVSIKGFYMYHVTLQLNMLIDLGG